MPRTPMDTISQARLVVELKLAIDAGNHSRIEKLIRENPRSARVSHVVRNIGVRRASILAASLRGTST